jgi:hypothetical protein
MAMKKFLGALMAVLGFAQTAQAGAESQMVDPDEILFSMPTIANDLPPLDPLAGPPAAGAFALHEDEWTQNEFLPKEMLAEVRRMLGELKTFEVQNREGPGWRNIYVRDLKRAPLIAGKSALEHLQSVLGVKTGPAPLVTSVEGVARVRNGFTIEIGRNVLLYGYEDGSGIPVIAASLGPNPDDQRLTETFTKLNASDGLVFVDWRQQMLLVSTATDGRIEVWRP